MFPYRVSGRDVHPFQNVIVVVFQLLLMSSQYYVINGGYCDNALALAYSMQPTACQNLPQCLPTNCQQVLFSASTACSSSVTY